MFVEDVTRYGAICVNKSPAPIEKSYLLREERRFTHVNTTSTLRSGHHAVPVALLAVQHEASIKYSYYYKDSQLIYILYIHEKLEVIFCTK